MLNLNSVMLGSSEPKALAGFYESVLGKGPDFMEANWYGFNAGSCYLTIGFHDQVSGSSTSPERIILNFETKNVKQEFERIKELGAQVIKPPYQMSEDASDSWIATFADPEGNYFQLMSPWE